MKYFQELYVISRYCIFSDTKANDLKSCIVSCCDSKTCNVAFLYDTNCYLITCNSSYPEGCAPKERKGQKFENTYMVNARSLGKIQAFDYLSILLGHGYHLFETWMTDHGFQNHSGFNLHSFVVGYVGRAHAHQTANGERKLSVARMFYMVLCYTIRIKR